MWRCEGVGMPYYTVVVHGGMSRLIEAGYEVGRSPAAATA